MIRCLLMHSADSIVDNKYSFSKDSQTQRCTCYDTAQLIDVFELPICIPIVFDTPFLKIIDRQYVNHEDTPI